MARRPERKQQGLTEGGVGIFGFAVSVTFLDRFFGFCTKKRLILFEKYLLIREKREKHTAISFVNLIAAKQKRMISIRGELKLENGRLNLH